MVRAELKLYDNEPMALYFAIAENKKRTGSLMEESTLKDTRQPSTGSSENPDRQVRQEPLLAQEAALPSSSDLTITDFYNLVKHDANFTKYFSDEVAYQAEGIQVALLAEGAGRDRFGAVVSSTEPSESICRPRE